MTDSEIDLLLRAVDLLQKLVPDGESRPQRPASRPCPVLDFARRYLVRDPADDMTTVELWQFYKEVASAREVEALGRRAFERASPGAMGEAFQLKKSHSVRRDGGALRGFKEVTVRG